MTFHPLFINDEPNPEVGPFIEARIEYMNNLFGLKPNHVLSEEHPDVPEGMLGIVEGSPVLYHSKESGPLEGGGGSNLSLEELEEFMKESGWDTVFSIEQLQTDPGKTQELLERSKQFQDASIMKDGEALSCFAPHPEVPQGVIAFKPGSGVGYFSPAHQEAFSSAPGAIQTPGMVFNN